MDMRDAIKTLGDMYQHELSMSVFAESQERGNIADMYYKKAKALQLAISVLEALERNRAKAVNVLAALRRCYDYPERCYGCPYHDDTNPACGRQMDDDIEKILAATYEEWGENDDEQD